MGLPPLRMALVLCERGGKEGGGKGRCVSVSCIAVQGTWQTYGLVVFWSTWITYGTGTDGMAFSR